MVEQIDIFTGLIRMAGPTNPVNATDMLRRLSMDISVLLGFGTAVNLQTSKEYDYFFTSLGLFNLRINLYMNFPALSKLQLDQLLKRSPMRRQWRETIWNMVQTRLKEDSNAKHDFYSFVSSSLELEARDMQESELFSESLFFLSAGSSQLLPIKVPYTHLV
jgi:cytochrome P450